MIATIPPQDEERFCKLVEQFRERWTAGLPGPLAGDCLEAWLPPQADPLRRPALLELVAIDLVARLTRGEKVSLRDYLAVCEDLRPVEQLPVELLLIEFSAANRARLPVSADRYASQYPVQSDAFLGRLRTGNDLELQRFFDGIAEMLNVVRASATNGDLSATLPIPADAADADAAATDILGSDDAVAPDEPPGGLGQTMQPQPNDAAELTESGRLINLESGYRMIREIGRGNFGEVWLCEAPGGVEVALKLVRIPAGQRLKHVEVRSLDLMKRLRHPFLIQVQAFWLTDSQIVIAMELGDHSLRERAAECGGRSIPLRELLRYLNEAAEGIDYLHREHVVHRDIKPENLLLLKGHVKVADFGLARFIDDSGISRAATQVAGSPLYMAPEVWEGRPVAASDQYSLAITYLELRLGRAPLSSTSVAAVMREHLGGRINLEGIPAAEQAVLRKALSTNPARRFENCSQFVQELTQAAAPDEAAKKTRFPALAAAAVAILVLAGAAIAAVALRPSGGGIAPDVHLYGSVKLPFGAAAERMLTPVGAANSVAAVRAVDPPRGVTLDFDPKESILRLTADINAPLGPQRVELRVETAAAVLSKELQIEVVESDLLRVPPGKQPAHGAKRVGVDGLIYYDRIEHATPGGGRVEFVLIPRGEGDDFRTFYAAKLEVSNRLFAEYAQQHADRFTSASDFVWRKGPLAGRQYLGVEGPQADLPAVFVNADQAHGFAEWVGGLLPTREQWDAAAGELPTGSSSSAAEVVGPFVGPYLPDATEVCVDRIAEGPAAVGSSEDDVSPVGVRDLAGSVRELTRDLLFSDQKVPLESPPPSTLVIVRGNGYHDLLPWQYKDAADDDPAAIPYTESEPGQEDNVTSDIGFRIVLEL